MIRRICMALLVSLGCVAGAQAEETTAARMFDRLRGLAGEWEGTFTWTDGRTGSGPLKATYYLTGFGSALIEDLLMDGKPYMTSIYHLDGPDLRVTHYCAAGNQPRFKAKKIDESAGTIEFTFVDVTNVTPKRPAHVEAIGLELVSADQVKVVFTFGGGPGMSGVEHIALKRTRPAPANG